MNEESVRREGFWRSDQEPDLPFPQLQREPWEGEQEFIDILIERQKFSTVTYYRGFSTCRICHVNTGNSEFFLRGWRWPGGFLHYVIEHNVKPSKLFIDFIMGESE